MPWTAHAETLLRRPFRLPFILSLGTTSVTLFVFTLGVLPFLIENSLSLVLMLSFGSWSSIVLSLDILTTGQPAHVGNRESRPFEFGAVFQVNTDVGDQILDHGSY